ncbi:sugar-binding transcriptional regulator [Pectinatus frisingensis]|uniref:sugar-binding transcriptional regulator n=1 Tax=Pectinatus frisingensis TaxID=865 RepID=UPI0018C61E3C|nr:sugar-binding domain-containing protein [Pectinatus frisingensis]
MKTKEDLLIRASELYYQQNLNQNEIAKILNVSRPTVSRLLEEARQSNIIEIIIHSAIKKNSDLANKLRIKFHLKDAIVIAGDYPYYEALQKCGIAAAHFLNGILDNNISLGITWGIPMNYFADALSSQKYYNINVVQMVGCLGSGNPKLDGLELAITISKKLNGTYSNIYAPVFIDNRAVYEYLIAEPQIALTLKKALMTDIVITGIGSLYDEESTLQKAGYLSENDRQDLLAKGGIGHLLSRVFDKNGNELIQKNKYVISPPLSCLKTPRWVICMAVHEKKALPLLTAMKAKYINTIIVDEKLAISLLNNS